MQNSMTNGMAWHVLLFIVQLLFTIRFFDNPKKSNNNNNNKDLSHEIDQKIHIHCVWFECVHNTLCRERKAKITTTTVPQIDHVALLSSISFFYFFIPSSYNKSNMLFYNWIWKKKKQLIKYIVKQQIQNDVIKKKNKAKRSKKMWSF